MAILSGRAGKKGAKQKKAAKPKKCGTEAEYNRTSTKKSIRSNDKTIIEKNQRTILNEYDPKEYSGKSTKAELFASDIDRLKEGRKISTQQAVREWLNMPFTEYTHYGRAKYLNKVGMNKYDAEKINDWSDRQVEEANNLYENMMVRDGTNLYNDIKSGKTKKPAKTTSKRK